MLTKSKTEMPLNNGAKLHRVRMGVSTIDEIDVVEVDTDKIGILTKVVLKIVVDVDKIVEQTKVLIEYARASLVDEEVTDNLVDEVLDTSIVGTWSWEVFDAD